MKMLDLKANKATKILAVFFRGDTKGRISTVEEASTAVFVRQKDVLTSAALQGPVKDNGEGLFYAVDGSGETAYGVYLVGKVAPGNHNLHSLRQDAKEVDVAALWQSECIRRYDDFRANADLASQLSVSEEGCGMAMGAGWR